MEPEMAKLLRRSFAQIARRKSAVGRLFYARLFTFAPELRALFSNDLASQSRKFVDTVGLCIAQIDHPEMLETTLRDLGERHATYGVKTEHYPLVGAALISTLEETFGDGFRPEVREAWATLYARATDAMTAALHRADSGPGAPGDPPG